MFGILRSKPAPQGPVEFRVEVVVGKPAAEVYALIDFADPRNAKRQLGNHVAPVEGEAGRYDMVLNTLPGHRFEITVDEAVPPASYAFTSTTLPMIGRLARSHERYDFEPLDDASCRLTLAVTATFVHGMRLKDFHHEVGMMALACQSAAEKIRIHAEAGLQAARSVENLLVA
jgi:hypothetical protein